MKMTIKVKSFKRNTKSFKVEWMHNRKMEFALITPFDVYDENLKKTAEGFYCKKVKDGFLIQGEGWICGSFESRNDLLKKLELGKKEIIFVEEEALVEI